RRSTTPWDEVLVDLRVDDDADPVAKLAELLPRARAFATVGGVMFARGLTLGPYEGVEPDQLEGHLRQLIRAAEIIGPKNREADFWRAVLLARAGRHREAGDLFAEVVAFRPALRRFVEGLAP